MKRALLAALLTLLASAGATDPKKEDSQTFTVEQARVLARQALYAGRFDLARDVATVLVRTNPEDAYAYGILAAAQSRLKAHKQARSAARLSYKHSETPAQKFGAARTAASIAFQQERPTASQIWLRLAATHAENPKQEEVLSRDYAKVRRANPLRFNINLSVAPSDNVNNGTDNVLEVINDVPTLGVFNGSSRALPGTVGTLDVQLRYRIAQSKKSQTSVMGRLYTRRVDLSESAEDIAPNVKNSDFASTYVEAGIDHAFALGAPGNSLRLGGALGASWFGGDRSYDFLKLNLSRGLKLSPSSNLTLRTGAERRFSTRGTIRDTDVVTLGATVSHKLKRGDKVSVGLTVQDVTGDFVNADYQTASLRANYTFGKQLGPIQISTGLTFGYTDYEDYRLVRTVDGGRQDESLYGDVSLFFADYDFAGFAPTIRLRTGRRSSNVNRFEIDETTITLGIQSKF
ncbi:surface lipoprotein assembly modifier [uncultured Tateyamaria sp.]|uniref:surface lipoprotein assembly modifier n=1 Tax=uncultured Tateyamaria sp. TaxID=455651 RepID=UPI00262C8DB6|nr:surface lipoprotein assembly modifier [uncultured Tateyamaria sp.]